MARRQLGVRLAHGILGIAQENGPLGVGVHVGDAPALGGRAVGGMRSGALAHQGIALMARRGEQVGGELENRAIVVLEPAQDIHERLLRRVPRVLLRARQPQAVVEDLRGVSVV